MPDYANMTYEELETIVREASAALNAKKDARRAELLAELEKLGGAPKAARKPRAASTTGETDGRASPKPMYRSFKNPDTTWSGRGARAKWLTAEMAESGRPLEDFLIKNQGIQ